MMAPAKPWGNANKMAIPGGSSFPGLKQGATSEPVKRSQYEEVQQDELIALASIYGDDFQHMEAKGGAWKRMEPTFDIRIKSVDEDLAVTLQVVFVATYPKSAPLLSLKDDDNLREGTRFKLQKVIETLPKKLVVEEQAMIMEVVDAVRDILEDAAIVVAAGRELPSLEEERANHEAVAAQIAKEHEEEEGRRRQDEIREEERLLENMVQEELKRQRAKAKEAKKKSRPPNMNDELSLGIDTDDLKEKFIFDQPITLIDDNSYPQLFQAVADKCLIRTGPVSECFTVHPILKGNTSLLLALKQTNLGNHEKDNNFKTQLRALETDLEILKKARHRNVLELLDFKVHKTMGDLENTENPWTISVLTEYADKGSLDELLDVAGSLSVEKARAWTIELLDALRYLHDRGVVHQDLHANNIMIIRSTAGDITVKIADAGFQRQIHNLKGVRAGNSLSLARSAYWLPPESSNTYKPHYTQKTDIWDFGIVFLQMIFGLNVLQKYASPDRLTDALALSESLEEIVHKFFKSDARKRPRAFELSSCEFLATDAPIMAGDSSTIPSRLGSITSSVPATPGRNRHDSMNTGASFSRYKIDFTEEGRLGKGGFGEVVKARKKLDGQFYAIKKITQKSSASLTDILKEVRLLSQLSHPYVVRYYNTWTEEISEISETDDDTTEATTENSTNSTSVLPTNAELNIEFGISTGGLDFISSSGYPAVEFGYETDENAASSDDGEDTEDEEDVEDVSSGQIGIKKELDDVDECKSQELALKLIRSDSRHLKSTKTILYIQMEYCERRTLRDLIKRGLYKDGEEIWRILREAIEGLAHIHSLNVVHRDLKPENIFIDGSVNVRIGDFGLATSGHYAAPDKVNSNQVHSSHNMTTSIGTFYYVAPEVRSSVGTYNSKVDMYSLGIILFEMCYPPVEGMERAQVLKGLREFHPVLPSDFNTTERRVQAKIILSLVDHNQKDRPSSLGLLQSGQLPVQMESETIRQTLAGLSDPKSPYYQKMMQALFSRPMTQAQDFAWDMESSPNPGMQELMLQNIVKQRLSTIFRRHGALESPRPCLFPRSGHYGSNAVQLLDQSGTLVQLPYDLTLPLARQIAKNAPPIARSFTFGNVFRDKSGGQPKCFGEVDFDIVSDSLDLALKEAEVVKVLDEIVRGFPSLAGNHMCFHINHSDLLNLIFDFCKIDKSVRSSVAEVLSKLNVQQWTWLKIRNELRSPQIGVSATSLDDLQRFDFRDYPSKAFLKLKTIFENTDFFEKASPSIGHLNEVIDYLKRLEVQSQIFINPLSTLKEKFYQGGILFSCLYDSKRRDVFAAGGRYDSLIREHRPKIGGQSEDRHAVGFSLAWEKLANSVARYQKSGAKGFLKKPEDDVHGILTGRRCDVLVASFDATILRSTGIEILQNLWMNEISAELARDARSPEDLLTKYRDEQYTWIIIIKQDSTIKVKSMGRKEAPDVDIPISQLLPWLKNEARERDHREGITDRTKSLRHVSYSEASNGPEREQDIRVLVAQTKSKKSNRRNLIEQAQARTASLVRSFLDGPIVAIETTDHVMNLIKETRLSDPESWRKVSQSVPTAERRYIGEIHDLMKEMAEQNRVVTRNAFVYNFRTGNCIYYDMGL